MMNAKQINEQRVFLPRFALSFCLFLLALSLLDKQSVVIAQSDEITRLPLEFGEISVSPDPIVGQEVVLSITIISKNDEPEVKLIVDALVDAGNQAHLPGSGTSWEGSLLANQPQMISFPIKVLSNGSWPIEISAVTNWSNVNRYFIFETIHLQSSHDSGQLIRAKDFAYSQPVASEYFPEFLSLSSNNDLQQPVIATPSTGQVQIEGHLKYDARVDEDSQFPIPTIFSQSLGRVVVKLYDRQSNGDVEVGQTISDAGGHYVFSPVSNRSGIDLYLVIYATDNERVKVVDASDNTYRHGPVDVGQNLSDGITVKDYTIPVTFGGDPNASQPYFIFDLTANKAYNWMETETGGTWSGLGNQRMLTINWPVSCAPIFNGDCFRGPRYQSNGSSGEIYLQQDTEKRQDVFLHEYGHFVLSRLLTEQTIIGACWPPGHEFWAEVSKQECAWSEGWADFFEMAVQNDPDYIYGNDANWSFENVEHKLSGPDAITGTPEKFEGIVVATLWDIFDGANEPHDQFADGFDGSANDGIWHFSTTSAPGQTIPPFSLSAFWDSWKAGRPADACYGSAIF